MKYLAFMMLCILFAGCEPATDCLKSSGESKTIKLTADPFSAIEIVTEFNVTLREGPEQQVMLTAGKNLLEEINFEVIDETFIIRDNSTCKWSRAYDFPNLTISHPNLREIRQRGSGLIQSEGVLNYPTLLLASEDQSGDFRLEVACQSLTVSNNDVSNFYISGQADHLKIGFHSGDGRFEGGNLMAQHVEVVHCGSNDIIIQATDVLKGQLCAAGNLIYVTTVPALIDITSAGNGQLINRIE